MYELSPKAAKKRLATGLAIGTALLGGVPAVATAGTPSHPTSLEVLTQRANRKLHNFQRITLVNRVIAEQINPKGVFPTYHNWQIPFILQRWGESTDRPTLSAIQKGKYAIGAAQFIDGQPVATVKEYNPATMQILPAKLETIEPPEGTRVPLFESDRLIPTGEGLGDPFAAIGEDGVLRTSPKGNPAQVAFGYDAHK